MDLLIPTLTILFSGGLPVYESEGKDRKDIEVKFIESLSFCCTIVYARFHLTVLPYT